MTDAVPSTALHPADRSPEDRARAVAAILATGLVRLGSALLSPTSPPPEPQEKPGDSPPNRLADGGTKSVTVSAG